jgi:hypothetical protein
MMSTPTDRSSPMPSPSTRLCEPAPLPAPPTQWPSIPPPRNESEAAQIVQRVEQESESRQRLRSHRAAHTTHYPTLSPTEGANGLTIQPPPTDTPTDQRTPAARRSAPELDTSSSRHATAAMFPEYWDTAPTEQGMRQANDRAQALRDSIIGTGRSRGIRTTDLPSIDSVGRMTSERPDAFDSSTGLPTTRRATLIDNLFDNWQDLVETLHIPWMGDQHLAIASITAECLRQPNVNDCDMSVDAGMDREPASGNAAAESAGGQDAALSDGAAAAGAQQASQDMSEASASQGSGRCVQCPL